MGTSLIALVAALVGCAAGYLLGRGAGRSRGYDDGVREERKTTGNALGALAGSLRSGKLPESEAGARGAELVEAVRKNWVPAGVERDQAMSEAIRAVSGYLDRQVKEVLAAAGPSSTAKELREVATKALGNLADVSSYLTEPAVGGEPHDVVPVVQQVAREFAGDQGVRLRMHRDPGTLRASIRPEELMNALYLIFHNAARFGNAPVVDVAVEADGDHVRIAVKDRGSGFAAEALERAFDPFYTTAPDGLGLGLPYARRLVRAMGGSIELGNAPDGGGEVAVLLPKR